MAPKHPEKPDAAALRKKRRELQASYEKTEKLKLAGYGGLRKRLHGFRVEIRKRIVSINHRLRHLKQSKVKLGDAIDVSYAQPHVDWSRVKADGIKVGFRKITEGATYDDPAATESELGDMQRNVVPAIYHFCRPDNNSPATEVRHVANRAKQLGLKVISFEEAKKGKPGLVLLVDFEQAPYSEAWLIGFAKAARDALGIGWGALLYGGGYSLDPVLGAIKYFAGVMIAGYPHYSWHGPDSVLVFHQFTDSASVNGVSGGVDRSHYLGG